MSFCIEPIEGQNHEGRQWGYRVLQDGETLLEVTTGGTGPCWSLTSHMTYNAGAEPGYEHDTMHVCELEDFIDALITLRDSDANRQNVERWA